MARIGLFVCRCGRNIAGTVDVAEVAGILAEHPGVVHAEEYTYMCSDPGQLKVAQTIADQHLTSERAKSSPRRITGQTRRRLTHLRIRELDGRKHHFGDAFGFLVAATPDPQPLRPIDDRPVSVLAAIGGGRGMGIGGDGPHCVPGRPGMFRRSPVVSGAPSVLRSGRM